MSDTNPTDTILQYGTSTEVAVLGYFKIVIPLLVIALRFLLWRSGEGADSAPYQRRGRGSTQVLNSDEVLKKLREEEKLGLIDEESARSEYQSSRAEYVNRKRNKVHTNDVELKRLRQLEDRGLIDEETAILEYDGLRTHK